MAESAESSEIMWIEPHLRGIIPLDEFHVPRSLRKFIKRNPFSVSINTCFEDVVARCADRSETWINKKIKFLYTKLHEENRAHSVEVWYQGELVGGLYGVHIGAAFFGESMFSNATNASKVALVYLVARLKAGGFQLLDTQFITNHLKQFGTLEIPQNEYKNLLQKALSYSADFSTLSGSEPPEVVLQLSSQTSYRG